MIGSVAASGWSLLDPWFLGLVPLVWLGWLWRAKRPRAALTSASVAFFDGLPRSMRSRLVWLPGALKALALTALSWRLGARAAGPLLTLTALGVTLLKAQIVIDRFMGLRRVRARWRVLFAAWLLLVAAAVGVPLLLH